MVRTCRHNAGRFFLLDFARSDRRRNAAARWRLRCPARCGSRFRGSADGSAADKHGSARCRLFRQLRRSNPDSRYKSKSKFFPLFEDYLLPENLLYFFDGNFDVRVFSFVGVDGVKELLASDLVRRSAVVLNLTVIIWKNRDNFLREFSKFKTNSQKWDDFKKF